MLSELHTLGATRRREKTVLESHRERQSRHSFEEFQEQAARERVVNLTRAVRLIHEAKIQAYADWDRRMRDAKRVRNRQLRGEMLEMLQHDLNALEDKYGPLGR